MLEFLANWLTNVPVTAAPYALAALGLIVSERSGVLNLTAEGLMLVGALAGVATCLTLGGHPLVALLVSMLAACTVSLLFAGLVVVLRVNQVIAGLAIVFFCQGLTGLIGNVARWQNRPIEGLAKARHLAALRDSGDRPHPVRPGSDRLPLAPDLPGGEPHAPPLDGGTEAARRRREPRRG